MKRFTQLVPFLLFAALIPGRAQQKMPSFYPDETLKYKAFYHWGFIWIQAGEVVFSTRLKKEGGENRYYFISTGTSLKKYDWLYRVRERFEAIADTAALLPLNYWRSTEEGNRQTINTLQFDRKQQQIFSTSLKTGNPFVADTLELSDPCRDILSSVYYCRTLPYRQMKKGAKIKITMIVDGKINSARINYLGKEDVKLHKQNRIQCYKISLEVPEGTFFKGGETLTAWLSADDKLVPVQVEAKVFLGSVKAVISEIL